MFDRSAPYVSGEMDFLGFSSLNVQVPEDFLGMCFIRYPNSGASPVGKIDWASTRLSQVDEMRWNTIETSAGVYSSSALAALDAIVTFQRQNDATVYMGLYGTPRFYADNTTPHPTVTDYNAQGPWGSYGEGAHPTSLTAVADFVTMLVNRYNKPGGDWYDDNYATLGKGIQYWEPWNEPAVVTTGSNENGYYWGSKNQLVDLCVVQYDTIKALDSSIVVTSPGFAPGEDIFGFMGASGSAYPSDTGSSAGEVLSWHPYNRTPVYVRYGAWLENILYDDNVGIQTLKDKMTLYGYTRPLWISEWGVSGVTDSEEIITWYDAPASFRYAWMMRMLLTFAGHGVQSVHPWHWLETGSVGNSGDWQLDTDGVQKAYNDFADIVPGKTITELRHYVDGRVYVKVDGNEYTY